MSGNSQIIVDSNIVIAILNGEKKVTIKLEKQKVYIPSIVIGELYYGANQSKLSTKNKEKIEVFASKCTILLIDEATGKEYGIIKSELKQKGKPIPENDIWIAALAKQYDIPIATRDKHFKQIKGIDLVEL
ncbi:MAG: type II toxin-antitoxin system VapC family toxin [Chitinophagales bacterium]|nr:type II toxin-antitoxin system VapC family toxin [Chitinophagales bacterium]